MRSRNDGNESGAAVLTGFGMETTMSTTFENSASGRLQELFATGVRNAHALENQALSIMTPQVRRIEHYPEVAERLREHIEETNQQIRRLDEILDGLDTSASAIKDMATGFAGTMAAMGHSMAGDEILKNSFANYAFEHFEIASYRALIEMAQQAGDQQALPLLQESLQEEIAMAEWAGQNLPDVVQTYIRLETQGQKSGI